MAINKEKDTAVVVITHWIQLAAEYGERMIALHQGKVLIDADPRVTFSQAPLLAQTNVNPPQITQLCDQLQINPLPLTLEESERSMVVLLQNR
jgi:energy-coupling factor transport system ATP-binding protein